MMVQAGATHVVVMERAHPETIKVVVKAGQDFGVKVMGNNLAAADIFTHLPASAIRQQFLEIQ